MKTFITAVALTLTTFASFAQEASPAPEFDNFVSTRTRADVRAELQAALASGWRPAQGEASDAPEQRSAASTRSRAEVNAELQAALASGWRPSQGEASNYPVPQDLASTRAGVGAVAAQGKTVVR